MLKLNLHRGEKRIYYFTIKDKSGEVIDLTDKQVKMRVLSDLPPNHAEQIFEVDAEDLGADGTCKITLTETQTDIEPKIYYFEIYLIYPDGAEYVAEVGLFQIQKRGEGTEGITWNAPSELRMKLRLHDSSYEDEELQYFLEQAHKKVIMDCGQYQRYFTLGKYPTSIKDYYLPEGKLLKFIQIIHNDSIVDESNYTIDYEQGKITFSDDYDIGAGDFLYFEYIPHAFKDLEMLYAMKDILQQTYIQTASEITSNKIDWIENEITQLKTKLNSRAYGSFVDVGYRGRAWMI